MTSWIFVVVVVFCLLSLRSPLLAGASQRLFLNRVRDSQGKLRLTSYQFRHLSEKESFSSNSSKISKLKALIISIWVLFSFSNQDGLSRQCDAELWLGRPGSQAPPPDPGVSVHPHPRLNTYITWPMRREVLVPLHLVPLMWAWML